MPRLYQAQGAALKDWQQAQVDLATAQGGMNTAEIALAAVRSGLVFLGKSDADIDKIESTPDILQVNAETLVTAPIGGTVIQAAGAGDLGRTLSAPPPAPPAPST